MTDRFQTYLGDAVYAAVRDGRIVLWTSDGERTENEIFFEPEVMSALVTWLKKFLGKQLLDVRREANKVTPPSDTAAVTELVEIVTRNVDSAQAMADEFALWVPSFREAIAQQLTEEEKPNV